MEGLEDLTALGGHIHNTSLTELLDIDWILSEIGEDRYEFLTPAC